jgi:two-component system, response regulator PdtaR
VEDQFIMATDLKRRLEDMGYEIVGIAGKGEDAIKKTGETKPDLILMDVRIQGKLDGIDTAHQIRKRYNIPIFFLTAHYDDETLERAKKTYPIGYLTKPYSEIGIHTSIQMALNKQNEPKIRI